MLVLLARESHNGPATHKGNLDGERIRGRIAFRKISRNKSTQEEKYSND